MEPELLAHLKSIGVQGVRRVHMHEPLTAVLAVFVIQFARGTPQPEVLAWTCGRGVALSVMPGAGSSRWTTTSTQPTATRCFWSMAYRSQPQYDLMLSRPQGSRARATQSARRRRAVGCADQRHAQRPRSASGVAKTGVHAARASALGRLGLPALKPERAMAWLRARRMAGELERQAQMAMRGEYFALGSELTRQRRARTLR